MYASPGLGKQTFVRLHPSATLVGSSRRVTGHIAMDGAAIMGLPLLRAVMGFGMGAVSSQTDVLPDWREQTWKILFGNIWAWFSTMP